MAEDSPEGDATPMFDRAGFVMGERRNILLSEVIHDIDRSLGDEWDVPNKLHVVHSPLSTAAHFPDAANMALEDGTPYAVDTILLEGDDVAKSVLMAHRSLQENNVGVAAAILAVEVYLNFMSEGSFGHTEQSVEVRRYLAMGCDGKPQSWQRRRDDPTGEIALQENEDASGRPLTALQVIVGAHGKVDNDTLLDFLVDQVTLDTAKVFQHSYENNEPHLLEVAPLVGLIDVAGDFYYGRHTKEPLTPPPSPGQPSMNPEWIKWASGVLRSVYDRGWEGLDIQQCVKNISGIELEATDYVDEDVLRYFLYSSERDFTRSASLSVLQDDPQQESTFRSNLSETILDGGASI